jgi:transcriptional regulator with XRE-family HTH domain
MRSNQELEQLRVTAIGLRRAGRSRREIKEILGVGNSTLGPALRGEPPPAWTARPNAKDDLHARARELRASGSTYDEIAAELGVSKSSVSLWVRDVPRRGRLSYEEFRRRNAEGVARYWQAEAARRESGRRDISVAAAAQIDHLSDREIVIAGAIAYWCEGTKSKPYRRTDRVVFVNSDPGLIAFFLRFLTAAGTAQDRLICRVHIHESADVAAAQRFWQDVTGLSAGQFREPTLKRHNPKTVRKNTGDNYHGCLVISVRRSVRLYRQIEGWAAAAMAAASKDPEEGSPTGHDPNSNTAPGEGFEPSTSRTKTARPCQLDHPGMRGLEG